MPLSRRPPCRDAPSASSKMCRSLYSRARERARHLRAPRRPSATSPLDPGRGISLSWKAVARTRSSWEGGCSAYRTNSAHNYLGGPLETHPPTDPLLPIRDPFNPTSRRNSAPLVAHIPRVLHHPDVCHFRFAEPLPGDRCGSSFELPAASGTQPSTPKENSNASFHLGRGVCARTS